MIIVTVSKMFYDLISLTLFDKFFKGKEKPLTIKQVEITYRQVALQYCNLFNVPVKYVLAVIKQESSGKPSAVGTSGEIGLCQLTKYSLTDYNMKNIFENYRLDQLFIPEINIKVATWYLSFLKTFYDDWFTVFRAYNAGIGKIKNNHTISVKYANSIMDYADQL